MQSLATTGEFDPAQATDVPVVIGADRGFASSTSQDLLNHLSYPLGVLDLARQGGSPQEAIELVKQRDFKPVANIERPELFDLSHDPLHVEVTDPAGNRETY